MLASVIARRNENAQQGQLSVSLVPSILGTASVVVVVIQITTERVVTFDIKMTWHIEWMLFQSIYSQFGWKC